MSYTRISSLKTSWPPAIKYCGLTCFEDLHCAAHVAVTRPDIKVQASFLYDVEGGNPADFEKRKNGLAELKKLIDKCRTIPMEPVIVTDATDPIKLKEMARALALKDIAFQLSGDITEEAIRVIRENAQGQVKIIKTIHVGDDFESAYKEATRWDTSPYVDGLLFDSCNGDKKGGTGKAHNWKITAEIIRMIDKPCGLAGGLSIGNVADAIMQVMPRWVDVDTGTRLELKQGATRVFENYRRDMAKCVAFAEAAASALVMTSTRVETQHVRSMGDRQQKLIS